MIETEIQIGSKGSITEFLPDGRAVNITILNPVPHVPNPSEKAIHEANHITADPDNVEGATINATEDFDAATFVKGYSRKGAGASLHMPGHGHDENLILAHGDSPFAAAIEAKFALMGKEKQIHAVASALDIERSITGMRAREIIDRVTQGPTALVTVTDIEGEVETQEVHGAEEIIIADFTDKKSAEEQADDKSTNLIRFPKNPDIMDDELADAA